MTALRLVGWTLAVCLPCAAWIVWAAARAAA
jgi:hypothetical protein